MTKEHSERYTVENSYYKSVLREYIKFHVIEPIKKYPTTISDTLIEIIISRLEELYIYTIRFPEIVSPTSSRLDILKAITTQFLFEIREEANLEEQIDILEHILYVYMRRGSVDSIENMWKYYGGDLPKDIRINIPSSRIFRYSISKFSGRDVYQDSNTFRSGAYEVILYNSNYPIDKLKKFMLKELVAAGNKIYFTNSIYDMLLGENALCSYNITENFFQKLDLYVSNSYDGLTWSGLGTLSSNSSSSYFSSSRNLFIEITNMLFMDLVQLNTYSPSNIEISVINTKSLLVFFDMNVLNYDITKKYEPLVTYTIEGIPVTTELHYYNIQDEPVDNPTFNGYFILCKTLLGSEVV